MRVDKGKTKEKAEEVELLPVDAGGWLWRKSVMSSTQSRLILNLVWRPKRSTLILAEPDT